MLGSSRVATQLAASQEGLSSMSDITVYHLTSETRLYYIALTSAIYVSAMFLLLVAEN
jgi:hypothetical protein